MEVLTQFSENERAYLLYEQRRDAERLERTWQRMLARKDGELERKDGELKRKDGELKRKDGELEQERREKEYFRELLRQAGLDPDQQTPPGAED
jgi:hypothetical protein